MDSVELSDEQKTQKQRHEWLIALLMAAMLCGVYYLLQSTFVQDWWQARNYQAEGRVAEIETDLALTDKGQRIYRATLPVVETEEDFNEHCNSHEVEVSLLGCYVGGKIYIYEITLEQLKDSNKVTAAHELLHAAWARMHSSEKEDVTWWLERVKVENAEWAKSELELYDEANQTEEFYARVGTKLSQLPKELEEHYAKYFRDRQKIVAFYESYQIPFNELKERNAELGEEILRIKQEINLEKALYTEEVERVGQVIIEFNECANREGCFGSDEEFQQERARVEQERLDLEERRAMLNKKIEENNAKVDEYTKNQAMLGELSEAMNSNITKETI